MVVRLVLLFCMFYSSDILAEEKIKLTISPEKCAITSNAKQCVVIIKLSWPKNNFDELCLYIQQQKNICSNGREKAEVNINIVSTRNILFELRAKSKIIDSAEFKVLTEKTISLKDRFLPWRFL